jgi:hypothetical protein
VSGFSAPIFALLTEGASLRRFVSSYSQKLVAGMVAKFALIASGYDEDDLDGTYDGILASAALDGQALAQKAGEART